MREKEIRRDLTIYRPIHPFDPVKTNSNDDDNDNDDEISSKLVDNLERLKANQAIRKKTSLYI